MTYNLQVHVVDHCMGHLNERYMNFTGTLPPIILPMVLLYLIGISTATAIVGLLSSFFTTTLLTLCHNPVDMRTVMIVIL